MVEMTVAGIALDASNRSPIVLLRDPSGRRQVPIWIDHAQAHNIVAGFQQPNESKPLTHDLIVSLLNMGGLLLDRIIIHDIEENNFQALLKLRFKNASNDNPESDSPTTLEIEARPSDAIALAIRTKCTIWMFEKVVAEASIPVDEEADEKDQDEFRHFLNDVKPADLIRHLTDKDQINKESFDQPDSEHKNHN